MHNKVHAQPRGRVLGGSSAINYLVYVRGQSGEYDDWATLSGYSSWDWKSLKPSFLKSERFNEHVPPLGGPELDPTHGDSGFRSEHHGTEGAISTSFSTYRCPVDAAFHKSVRNAGLSGMPPDDAWSGSHLGSYSGFNTIDRSTDRPTRSYSVTGYLLPNASRPNLAVLTEALVDKVLVEKDGEQAVAKGVAFSHGGKSYKVPADSDVILCAGTYKTPQILELSGIGSPRVLGAAGIETIVPNERVGEHLEDHLMAGLNYELHPSHFTWDNITRPEILSSLMEQYASGKGGPIANGVSNNNFLSLADVATREEMDAILSASQRPPQGCTSAEHEILRARLADPSVASFQVMILPATFDISRGDDHHLAAAPQPQRSGVTCLVCITHPWSRGSVHVASRDPGEQPTIDPGYFTHPVDLLVLAVGLRAMAGAFEVSPLREMVLERTAPGREVDLGVTEEAVGFLRTNTATEYHPIGTAGLGAVVDERLNVVGVRGLKVCDASVMPLHVSGNIVAPVYAVAEKGADLFREERGRGVKAT